MLQFLRDAERFVLNFWLNSCSLSKRTLLPGVLTAPIRGRGCWAARAVALALYMSGAMTVTASLALAAPVLPDQRTFVPIEPAALVPTPSLITWRVFPTLVQRGSGVTVSWEATNAASCSVTGTNGDAWTGLSGVHISGPIPAQTIYALHCPPLSGSPAPAIDKSVTVNTVPIFHE